MKHLPEHKTGRRFFASLRMTVYCHPERSEGFSKAPTGSVMLSLSKHLPNPHTGGKLLRLHYASLRMTVYCHAERCEASSKASYRLCHAELVEASSKASYRWEASSTTLCCAQNDSVERNEASSKVSYRQMGWRIAGPSYCAFMLFVILR